MDKKLIIKYALGMVLAVVTVVFAGTPISDAVQIAFNTEQAKTVCSNLLEAK